MPITQCISHCRANVSSTGMIRWTSLSMPGGTSLWSPQHTEALRTMMSGTWLYSVWVDVHTCMYSTWDIVTCFWQNLDSFKSFKWVNYICIVAIYCILYAVHPVPSMPLLTSCTRACSCCSPAAGPVIYHNILIKSGWINICSRKWSLILQKNLLLPIISKNIFKSN